MLPLFFGWRPANFAMFLAEDVAADVVDGVVSRACCLVFC